LKNNLWGYKENTYKFKIFCPNKIIYFLNLIVFHQHKNISVPISITINSIKEHLKYFYNDPSGDAIKNKNRQSNFDHNRLFNCRLAKP